MGDARLWRAVQAQLSATTIGDLARAAGARGPGDVHGLLAIVELKSGELVGLVPDDLAPNLAADYAADAWHELSCGGSCKFCRDDD